jgi:hypothetical protein
MTSLPQAAGFAAWSVHAYVVLAGQVHENHMALVVPFALIAGALDRRLRPMFWAVSAIATLNLVLFYGLFVLRPLGISRQTTGIDMTVLLAIGNVAAFAWHTVIFRRVALTPRPS